MATSTNSTNNSSLDKQVNVIGTPSFASKVLVVLLILASLVFIANMTLQLFGKNELSQTKVDEDTYQAVWLTNGEVYIGRLDNISNQFVQLSEAYFLQPADGELDEATDGEAASQVENLVPTQEQSPKISLEGLELQGPQHQLYISRDQVLFWQNLQASDNNDVLKAIDEFKTENN